MKHFQIRKSITDRSITSVNLYLKEISRYPLLSPEKEVEVTRLIKQGDINARNLLITSNLRFVISIAKQYQNNGLEFPDLIEAGNLGLIKAAEKFDETRGFKFISYAVWWIRQSILLALSSTTKTIRIPLSRLNLLTQINKFINSFEQENERIPTSFEIANYFQLDEDLIKETLYKNTSTVSLDTPIGDEDVEQLSDIIPSENTNNSENITYMQEQIRNALNILKPTEKTIICKYFGINTTEMSIEDIATELNLTKERVKQIKDYVIFKLRKEEHNLQLVKCLG